MNYLGFEGLKVLISTRKISRRLPLNLRPEDTDLYSGNKVYMTSQTTLSGFGSVNLTSESVVYRGIRLEKETVVTDSQLSYYRFRHLIKKVLTNRRVSLSKNAKYLLVTDAWSAGHYHWFTEVMPKLLMIAAQAGDFVLLLPDSPYLRTIGLDSIDRLGVVFADVQWMEENEFYKVPDLYYISRIASPGQVHDGLMQEINKRFLKKTGTAKRRLYISRSEAKIRKVLNEQELSTILEKHGFETVRPESLSLDEQVELFSSCGSLLGIHGAGLTNCLFMPPGGSVIELLKREPNHGYWHLAGSLGHRYIYLHGTPDSELSLIGKGCNLTISPTELDTLLSKVNDADFGR